MHEGRIRFVVWGSLVAMAINFSPQACQAQPEPQALKVKVSLNKKSAAILDPLIYTISIPAQQYTDIEVADSGKNLGDFEISNFSRRASSLFGRKKTTLRYTLVASEPGKKKIPPVIIKYRKRNEKEWKEFRVPEREIEIKSLVGEPGSKVDIRDIKGPLGVSGKFPWKIALFLAIVAAIFLGYKYFWRSKDTPTLSPVRPAHEIAYEQLEALKEKGFIRQGKIKEYYSELSDIVRHYLENRFTLKAPEMTTEEFLVFVRDQAVLQAAHKDLLKDFLSSCDLVKFAKYVPPLDDTGLAFSAAKRFVDESREV